MNQQQKQNKHNKNNKNKINVTPSTRSNNRAVVHSPTQHVNTQTQNTVQTHSNFFIFKNHRPIKIRYPGVALDM